MNAKTSAYTFLFSPKTGGDTEGVEDFFHPADFLLPRQDLKEWSKQSTVQQHLHPPTIPDPKLIDKPSKPE